MSSVPVYLNVYDLHRHNRWAYAIGLGAFHAGVELLGREYSYGYHQYDSTGVYDIEPRTAPGAVFRESILLGYTTLGQRGMAAELDRLREEFSGNTYHMLTRNCCTFCDRLCAALCNGRRIPNWVNRLPWLASCVECALPRSLRGPFPAEESVPIMPPRGERFPGDGQSLGGTGSGSEETLAQRREKVLNAAILRSHM